MVPNSASCILTMVKPSEVRGKNREKVVVTLLSGGGDEKKGSL